MGGTREVTGMTTLLKDSFGPDVPARIADMIVSSYSSFDRASFVTKALDGYEALELTPRARHIASVLAEFLPEDRERGLSILVDSLGPEIGDSELTGMETFIYMPHVFFIADHGIDHFEAAMRAQYEVTKRFTAEFSVREYLDRYPQQTLDRLMEWTRDPNVHVRRLVSKGTRPRLPWARRLRRFQEDPSPVLDLLEELKDDPEEYVRRSVANNLNDISKDHPERIVEVAQRWWVGASVHRKRLVRHALRSMVKRGHTGALAVLGYAPDSPVSIRSVVCSPETVEIGGKVRIEVEVENPSEEEAHALVDLRIHFVKANGSTSPKVFKGRELALEPGGTATVRKTLSLAQHSTRKHYPGSHLIEIMLNGSTHPGRRFEVV